jgi:glycosyltransferase involved in cell wall biosynthesis
VTNRNAAAAEVDHKPRIAVVSPFLDRSFGTERIIIEWIHQLAENFEIHIYSQHVQDVDPNAAVVHRIPRLPGPHLFNYVWWFMANHIWRAFDRNFHGLRHDVVLSPGINCLDADTISVHIVFGEFFERVRSELRLRVNPVKFWPKLLHRRLYYGLIISLEKIVYRNEGNILVLIAQKTARDLGRIYGRQADCRVLYLGLNHERYNTSRRLALRGKARVEIGIADGRFAVLMVGNDWHKKGLRTLLTALTLLDDVPIDLLVVGRDDQAPFREMAANLGVEQRVRFLDPREDVEFYYAAADAYAGPSLEDTFALPPTEAMACGVPTIVSSENGACEIIQHGVDGLVLTDPKDAAGLAAMLRRLYEDEEYRAQLGAAGSQTTQQFTWKRNGEELKAVFEEILRRKGAVPSPENAAVR